MTELSLILSFDVAVVLVVATLMRWVFAHDNVPAEAQRLLIAIKGALSSISARQGRRTVAVVVLLGLANAAIAQHFGDAPGRAWLSVVGVIAGAGLSTLVGQVTLSFAVRSATATASALRGSSSSSVLTLALRGAALIALSVEAFVSLVLVLVTLAVLLVYGGGVDASLAAAQTLFAGVALGCVGAPVVSQLSGNAVATAGSFGLHDLNEASQARFRLEPRNPAMVVSAVGPHIGPAVTRAQDVASLSVLSYVTSIIATLAALHAAPGLAAFALLALPILIRSCGLLASAFALLSLRAEDGDDPVSLVFRGQLAAALMSAAGIFGACRWLLGEGSWSMALGIATLGLLGQVALTMLSRMYAERRSRLLSAVREAANARTESALGLGFATAGSLTVVGLVALTALLGLASVLGSSATLPGGLGVALALTLSGFLSTLALSLALGSVDPILESACGLASLSAEGSQPQVQARLAVLDFVALSSGSLSQSHSAGGGLMIATALALTFGHDSLRADNPMPAVIAVAAFLGVAFVLLVSSLALRQATTAIASSQREAKRQLRGFGRDAKGALLVPADFSPSYRDQLQAVSDGALMNVVAPVVVCLVAPLLLGAATLQWLGQEQLRIALGCFLAVGGVTGFVLTGLSSTTIHLIGGARRHSRASSAGQQLALNRADLFAQALGTSLGPASRLAVSGAMAAGLVMVASGL